MSIMQEYEKIKKEIGEEKFDTIEQYIDEICPKSNFRMYEKELNSLTGLELEEWDKQKKKLEQKREKQPRKKQKRKNLPQKNLQVKRK